MRLSFTIGLFSLFLSGTIISAEASREKDPNLISNGGFEQIENIGREDVTVSDWTVKGRKKGVVRQDSAMDLYGSKSLKIQLLELPDKGDWEIYQDISGASFKKNTDYRFSGWINSYKGSAAFKITLFKDGKAVKAFTLEVWNGKGEYKEKMGRWTKYSKIFNSGDSDLIRIACVLKNEERFLKDTVWFDGLEMLPKNYVKTDSLVGGPFPKEIYVDPKASDGGDGTKLKPFNKIQAALDAAGAGTTVKLNPGIYTEHIFFKRGGSANAPLSLSGGPDVVIQGAKPEKLKWEKVPEWGEGVYKTKSPIGFVRGVYYSPKRKPQEAFKLPLIRYERAGDDARKRDDAYHYRNVFSVGIMTKEKKPGQGFEVLRAVAMYNPDDKCIYVRFGNNQDPNKLLFRLLKGRSLVDIESLKNIVIEKLNIRSSVKGVSVRRSENIAVRHCKFETVEYGIVARYSKAVKIMNNDLTLKACHEMNPLRQVINTPDGLRYQHDVWRAFKWIGYYDRCGIIVSESSDCDVFSNYIHEHWDGISVYGRNNPNIRVSHNYLAHICDDGFTIHGDRGQQWCGNIVINSFANLRYWNNPSNKGPVYIYGNYFIDGKQDNLRFMNDTDANIYVYHNTTIGGDGIRYQAQKKTGTPNLYVYNNRFLGDFYGMTSRVRKAKIIPNFKAGYNTYLTDRYDVIAKYGLNKHGYCGVDNIEKGVDLSTFFGKPLPGCPPGYFKGKAPNCGASGLHLD